MAEIDLSLTDVFAQGFGYKTDAFKPDFAKVTGNGGPNSVTRTEFGGPALAPYYLALANGNEVYMPMEIQVGFDTVPGTDTTYAELLGVVNSSGAYTGRWQLPYPVFSIENNMKVIDTELTERSGMVSEKINFGGWRLHVKGMLINKNNEFPEADFTTLVKLYRLGIPVRLNNPATDILFMDTDNLGENLVTIRSLKIPENKGVKNVRYYELDLVQEIPFNLVDIGS